MAPLGSHRVERVRVKLKERSREKSQSKFGVALWLCPATVELVKFLQIVEDHRLALLGDDEGEDCGAAGQAGSHQGRVGLLVSRRQQSVG